VNRLQGRTKQSGASPHFLRWAILLSVLIHATILAWHRQNIAAPPPAVSELEVVMMNASTESAPVKASVLAQVNVDGAGQANTGVASSHLPYVGRTPDQVVLERLVKQRLQLEAEQEQLLTQLKSLTQTAEGRPAEQFLKDSDVTGQDERDQESIKLNNTITALTNKVQQYNQQPRKYFDAPAARQANYVEYIDQWRQRVEKLGAEQYPNDTEGKPYGSVQASVTIRSDGVIIDITIDRPSDKAVLNQAVRRITQLASPLPPFPRAMAQKVDQLVLTRTWHFVNGALQTR